MDGKLAVAMPVAKSYICHCHSDCTCLNSFRSLDYGAQISLGGFYAGKSMSIAGVVKDDDSFVGFTGIDAVELLELSLEVRAGH